MTTTLYGGTEDYGLPTTLSGYAELQPPVTIYSPSQNNYASQTNIKQRAPLIVPNLPLPSLPALPNAPSFGMSSSYSYDAPSYASSPLAPVQGMLPAAASVQGEVIQRLGPWAGLNAPLGEITQAMPDSPTSQATSSAASTEPSFNPAQYVPQLHQQAATIMNAPARPAGIAPASKDSADYAFYPPMGSDTVKDVYKKAAADLAGDLKTTPLTRAQKLGWLISPKAREIAEKRMLAERQANAQIYKDYVADLLEMKKAELAKHMSDQEQIKTVREYVNASDSERTAMERAQPQLAYYRDIPQSPEASYEIKAKQAKSLSEIAKSMTEINELQYAKEKNESATLQARNQAISAAAKANIDLSTMNDTIRGSKADADKKVSDAAVAQATQAQRIFQEEATSYLKQFEMAGAPAELQKKYLGNIAASNDIIDKIRKGQMDLVEGQARLTATLSSAAANLSMTGDNTDKGKKAAVQRLMQAALSAANLAQPINTEQPAKQSQKKGGTHTKSKAASPPAPAAPLALTGLNNAALQGGISAVGQMVPPPPPQMMIQGGVIDSNMIPGRAPMQFVPPPPPTGLPMASAPNIPAIGGGAAGIQANTASGLMPPPAPYAVPGGVLQQYPQYANASAIPPLQGIVQSTSNPVQAFNSALSAAMQPPPVQAVPPPAPTPPEMGTFERAAKYMQSGTGAPPMLGPANPPRGIQRFGLGGLALGQAFGSGIAKGIGGAVNKALAPYRMPPPEQIKAQYEEQAIRNADRIESIVITPWVTPESRGEKQGAWLTDPELISYFAHKGRDHFTMNELIKRAGWTLPPAGFNGGAPGAPQPMTKDHERFKRYETGGPPALPKPGDDAPYTQFNPRLLQRFKRKP